MSRHSLPLVAALLLACSSTGQQPGSGPAPMRVHVIGASVSGGFCDGPLFGAQEQGDSVPIRRVLDRWVDGEARVTGRGQLEMTTLFEHPFRTGERQILSAMKGKADIVVAVDFAFWFAYGPARGSDEAAARRARFDRGLALLAQLEMPVLLGDLPDVHGAAARMISPSWIPSREILADLNARLRAFAAEHDNIRLLPLAEAVAAMRSGKLRLPFAAGEVVAPREAMQQEDRVHATRLGMAYLCYLLQGDLAAAFPEGHPLHGRRWTFEQFVEAAGADGEVEELVSAEKTAGK